MNRFLGAVLGAAFVAGAGLPAQNTVRWNDVVGLLDDEAAQPPMVKVTLNRGMFRMGEPVRVSFRVAEDAFVVVARVDMMGRLTLLHPRGRTFPTQVSGGKDVSVSGTRSGTFGAFVATEQPGASGYVFALASRFPLDLSRLSQRDFSQWVTGVAWGAPTTRYVGDPYRVIQRFARLVLYNPDAAWDYDVEFYSVDQPLYQTASMSGYCSSFAGRGGLDWSGYGSYDSWYWDDPDGAYMSSRGGGYCGAYDMLQQCGYGYMIPGMTGYIIPAFCSGYRRGDQVTAGPGVPPPVRSDSVKVNPWAPDSVTRPWVDKIGDKVGQGQEMDPARPAPVRGWNADDDLSYSIPSRALRGMRGLKQEGGTPVRSPEVNGAGAGGPVPMPGRPVPQMADKPIEWVRPPRSFEPPTESGIDRMPSRGGARRDAEPVRPMGLREDRNPPPRANSPIFDRGPEPVRSPSNEPRHHAGSWEPPRGGYSPPMNSGYNPPSSSQDGYRGGSEGRPMSSPGIESRPSSGSGASSPPPAAKEPASGGGAKAAEPAEKKPSQP